VELIHLTPCAHGIGLGHCFDRCDAICLQFIILCDGHIFAGFEGGVTELLCEQVRLVVLHLERDDQFARIENFLPGRPGHDGRNSEGGNRLFVEALIWKF
jgi:hypothetical protein